MPENTKEGTEIGSLERAVSERKGIDLAQDVASAPPDPELVERARRRRFTAEYKLRSCGKPTRAASPVRSVRCCGSLLGV